MKQICKLCNQELKISKEAETAPSTGLTGLCNSCLERMGGSRKYSLKDFLDTLPVPVFSVNTEGIIELANTSAVRQFNKNVRYMEGYKGGEVFECAYAQLPEGCGNTIHCSACAVRRAIMHTFNTGESIHRQPAYLKLNDKQEHQEIHFLVTTIKYNQFVILKIEDVKPDKP